MYSKEIWVKNKFMSGSGPLDSVAPLHFMNRFWNPTRPHENCPYLHLGTKLIHLADQVLIDIFPNFFFFLKTWPICVVFIELDEM